MAQLTLLPLVLNHLIFPCCDLILTLPIKPCWTARIFWSPTSLLPCEECYNHCSLCLEILSPYSNLTCSITSLRCLCKCDLRRESFLTSYIIYFLLKRGTGRNGGGIDSICLYIEHLWEEENGVLLRDRGGIHSMAASEFIPYGYIIYFRLC